MTQDTVKALSDGELVQVIAWAQAEQKARTERRKQEMIAKIRELAQNIGVSVSIGGRRGRPVTRKRNSDISSVVRQNTA